MWASLQESPDLNVLLHLGTFVMCGRAWWLSPVIPSLRTMRQRVVSSRQAGLYSKTPISKINKYPGIESVITRGKEAAEVGV